MSTLQNRGCLVTGATGGIGERLARELAGRECRLFLTGRNAEALAALARSPELGGQVVGWVAADLAAGAGVDAVLAGTAESLGVVDAVVHSAGVFPVQPVEEITPEGVDCCLAVNLRSFMLLCRKLAPPMADRGWGRIVAIGSSSAYAGFPRTSVYCASKHGLLGFCRALDAELRERGVRVIEVSPGSVKTKMGRLVEGQDFRTFIEPEEVARATVHAMELDGAMVVNELRLNRMVMR